MPSKHVVRNFVEDSYYHVFNRGVEKRNIFLDEQDYRMFLYYLLVYLMPLEKVLSRYPKLPIRLYNKNLSSELDLVTYCLMPNHFHFLLYQKSRNGISKLMKQLTNAYTLYFNQKYKRVGGLVQGSFKAVAIETDELLLHISRYIHLNPIIREIVQTLEDYEWSSYVDYTTENVNSICKIAVILSHFSTPGAYKKFVLDQIDYARELECIKHLMIDG